MVLPYASEWITGTHGYSLFGRLGLEGLGSCTSRKFLYLNVIDLIIEKPFWGWGWRELSLAHFSGAYDNRFCEILDNAHNLPLHFAVELGLMVTLLLIVPFVWMCIKAKPWAASTVASQMAWAVLSLVLLHSMLEYPLWYGPFMLAFGMSMGLLCQSPTQQPKNQKPAQKRSALPGWLSFLGLIGLFYATFDYIRISQIYTVPEDRFAIFADAPYEFELELFEKIVALVFDNNLLTEDGILVLEHSKQTDFKNHSRLSYQKKYGGNMFSFFEHKETELE